ncbi:MAG: hypothetical protein H7Z42_22295 [Roseiflexaceae bacterium]|nr:hypothetical protein [Roseiflexaceae bacterium]
MTFAEFIEQSMAGLRLQTEAHNGTWHLGEEQRWGVDQDGGTITWEFAGTVASAPVQIIGTYNPSDGSLLWGWDHPSVLPPLAEHARLLRQYGEDNGIAQLTTRTIFCSEDEAWGFTSVAARLAGANGAYRADAGGPLVYMTFGNVTLSRPPGAPPAPPAAPAVEEHGIAGPPELIDFIQAYFKEMFAIDERYHQAEEAGEDVSQALHQAIDNKRAIYERYWQRDDEYWLPSSVGWPSDYDLAQAYNWTCRQLADGTYQVAYVTTLYNVDFHYTYSVRRSGEQYKITNFEF